MVEQYILMTFNERIFTMKTRFPFLIMLLLLLPLVLTACGGGDSDTAKKYIEAVAANDKDEASKYVCDDNKI